MAHNKSVDVFTLIAVICLLQPCKVQSQVNDRFAGVHFDFNAQAGDTSVGKNFSSALIDSFLQMVKPDYIQVDAKGNYGFSSYPTKTGNAAKGIKTDILKLYRESTLKNKVDLYVHYSALLDNYVNKQHPEWATVKADGSKDMILAYANDYTNTIMVPQIKELALNYKVNGVWIDADSYAASLNYTPAYQQKFKTAFGINAPKTKANPGFDKWIEFNRSQYMAYFKNYVDVIHNAAPGFKIINNYAYSSYMPFSPSVNVDYLSIDIKGREPYQAAFEGRCLAAQNKPWDIMSWSMMQMQNSVATKSFDQLAQEAANTLALGGGFEMYFFQHKDGSLPKESFKLIGDVIAFCKQRKDFSYEGKIVPQAGLFYSYNSWKDSLMGNALYTSIGTNGLREMMKILIDNQTSVDVLLQYQLKSKLNTYPLIIIPEWNNLGEDVIQQLLAYVNNGGNIIVEGADAVKPFAKYCNVSLSNKANAFTLNYNNASINISANFQQATTTGSNIEKIGNASLRGDKSNYPLATISQYGKGKIALLYFNVQNLYSRQNIQPVKNIVKDLTSKLFTPVAIINGAANIEQLVTTKNNHLYVHLINMSGKDVSYNNVAPVQSFSVQVRDSKKPVSVLLQPGNKKLSYTYNNGVINADVPGVDIYSIIDIQ